MSQRKHEPEQIIGKLREAEVLLSQGSTVDEVCRKIEVPLRQLRERSSRM